jgi:hypothetical protein
MPPPGPSVGLGTFSNKKISPVGGIPRPEQDQEAPYRIDIPGGEGNEEERRRRTKQSLIEREGIRAREQEEHDQNNARGKPTTSPTVAERVLGPQLSASEASAKSRTSGTGTGTAPSHNIPASQTHHPAVLATAPHLNTDLNNHRDVAELPGSKAHGYESEEEEEVVMSATAYPGNWQDPAMFYYTEQEDDERWDGRDGREGYGR